MARTARDTTNVYRFRVEHNSTYVTYEEYCGQRRGVYSGNAVPGAPYQDVTIVGPYTSKVSWNGWIPNYGTLKVERQQLVANVHPDELEGVLDWETIETKRYEDGEPVL